MKRKEIWLLWSRLNCSHFTSKAGPCQKISAIGYFLLSCFPQRLQNAAKIFQTPRYLVPVHKDSKGLMNFVRLCLVMWHNRKMGKFCLVSSKNHNWKSILKDQTGAMKKGSSHTFALLTYDFCKALCRYLILKRILLKKQVIFNELLESPIPS